MATVCCKKTQGIPLPGTPFKIKNAQWGRFIFNAEKTLFLRDNDTNRMELFFELIPSSSQPQRYIIKSVNTNLALTDDGTAGGYSDGLNAQVVSQDNRRQIWSIEPSPKFADGFYRIRNLETRGYLLNGPTDAGNCLRTYAIDVEFKDQNWSFIFTEGLGIPPIQTQMRIKNADHLRIIFADGKTVFLQDEVTDCREQVFRLVPSKLRPESYLIQSVNTDDCLADKNGKEDGVIVTSLDQSNLKQVWDLLPSTVNLGTYRLRNCDTQCFLLNGKENNLRTFNYPEYLDQCWIFLDS